MNTRVHDVPGPYAKAGSSPHGVRAMHSAARGRGALRVVALTVAMLLGGCAATPSTPARSPESGVPTSVRVAAAIAAPSRPTGDRLEDATRRSQAVLEFMDVRPGQRVLDAFAAGGYYTELLSILVGPSGRVVAYNNPPYFKFAEKAIAQRYSGGRLGNVEQINAPIETLVLAPRSLDAAIFVMAYHDLYWRPADGSWPPTDARVLLAKLHAALKPRGIVLVQDHAAAPGGEVSDVVNRLHRIDPARVRSDFEAAGFVFERANDALAHPEDDRSKLVFDPAIRGRTDQFLFRFRKPGN